MTRFSYFPGCSLHGTAREYDESIRAVAAILGIELAEVQDWCCCGATPAHATDLPAAHALGLWNLAQASRMGEAPVVTGCASCFSRLRAARQELREHPERLAEARVIAGQSVNPRLEVLHLVQVLADPEVLAKLKASVKRPLNKLPVACYYGCLLTRPPGEGAVDDAEEPRIMEDLARAVGAEPVDWPLRLDCCGSSLALARPEVVHDLSGKILASAHSRGAKALIVACPLCHSNLDFQQPQAAQARKLDFRMPILYLTQLLGVALGLSERQLGLQRHFVPVPVDELVPVGGP